VTLLRVLAIIALGFFCWLAGLLGVWWLLRVAGVRIDPWAMIQTLSSAVAAAAVFGGGIIAYRELRELARGRHAQVADRLFDELNSPESIEARRWVFQNLPGDPRVGSSSLTSEGHAAVKHVLNSLDRIAFLTQAGWIPEELIMPWINPMIVKAWIKLRPYVDYESDRRQEPDYYAQARELGERCLAWRARNLPGVQVKWINDAL